MFMSIWGKRLKMHGRSDGAGCWEGYNEVWSRGQKEDLKEVTASKATYCQV